MQTLMATFCNATEASREEEMNNWYTWVHIRDVMEMEGSIAVQRFALASAQPEDADLSRKYLALYEVADKFACTKEHMAKSSTPALEVSTSFDVRTFAEAYWDPCFSTADFAEYADYSGDKSVLTVRLDAAGSNKVEELFSLPVLKEIAGLPGFKAAHLYRYGADQMPTSAAKTEKVSHFLVCQLDNSYAAAAAWDSFLEANLNIKNGTIHTATIFAPIIDRFVAAESIKSPEWRAISYLSHAILGGSRTPIWGQK